MSIKEIINNQQLQDKKCLVLFDKPIIDTPRPPKPPKQSKIDLLLQEFREFKKEQQQFNQQIVKRLDKIDTRLDNIVTLNNLKE